MKKKNKPVPKFRNEQDEREFWSTHDTTDYFDFSKNRVEIEFDRGTELARDCPADGIDAEKTFV